MYGVRCGIVRRGAMQRPCDADGTPELEDARGGAGGGAMRRSHFQLLLFGRSLMDRRRLYGDDAAAAAAAAAAAIPVGVKSLQLRYIGL